MFPIFVAILFSMNVYRLSENENKVDSFSRSGTFIIA